MPAGKTVFISKREVLRSRGLRFSTLGIHCGDPGSHRDTSWDTFGSRLGFLVILGGFGDPLGDYFGDRWHNFVILDAKIRVGIRNLFPKRFCKEM